MYRVVNLPRKVLITTDEAINQGPTDETVSPRFILSAIQIAEERFIKPAIGTAMYNDFRDQKNVIVTDINKSYLEGLINDELNLATPIELAVGDIVNSLDLVTSDWYKQLWNEHLWKIAAEAVVYIAIPTNYTRFTASGQMQNNPRTVAFDGQGAGSQTAELKDVKFIMDKTLMDRIDPLIAAMHEWICENKINFPTYAKLKECKCNATGISVERKTGFVHGIYNDKKWRG
jgi:hypothetical protein